MRSMPASIGIVDRHQWNTQCRTVDSNEVNVPPILYTFRRCPYAIRARMALAYAGIITVQREVSLKNKPLDLIWTLDKHSSALTCPRP